MDAQKIKEIALANGFSLKQQASGNMDLHSYVYEFAEALIKEAEVQAVPEGFMLVKKRNVIGNPKVDWLQAPKWAKYWLKDGYSNKFWWCSNRPKLEEDYFLFHGRYSAEEAPSFGFNGDWKKSMTSRKAMIEAQEQSQ